MCSSFRHQIFEKTSVENPESRIQVYFYQMSKLIWKRLQDVIQWFGYLYELGLVNLLNISELRLWICQKNEKSVNNFSKPPSIITLLPKPKTICDYTTLIDELIKIPKLRDHGTLWSTQKKLKKKSWKKKITIKWAANYWYDLRPLRSAQCYTKSKRIIWNGVEKYLRLLDWWWILLVILLVLSYAPILDRLLIISVLSKFFI